MATLTGRNAAPGDAAALVRLAQLRWTEAQGSADFQALVRRHRLAPLAHVVGARAGDPTAVAFAQDYAQAVGHHLVVMSDLGELSWTLTGMPWAALKGPVLSLEAHPVPGVRPYGDLDILVEPQQLRAALRRLVDAGWSHVDTNHRLLVDRMPGELHLRSRQGVIMDLHWSLMHDVETRAAFPVDVYELLRRRRPAEGLGETPRLQDEDLLLHLCLHAAVSGADRLLWLVDVDQWVRRHPPDWEVLRDRAERARARSAVGTVLARSAAALGTPLPADVSSSGPTAWAWAVAAVDRAQPVPAVRADTSLAKLVARAARDGSPSSFLALLAHSAQGVRARLPGPRLASGELTDAVQDRAALEAYLAAVEQTGPGGYRRSAPRRGSAV